MQIYVVKPGDTLYGIARAFNSTVSEIVVANAIPEPDRLVIGQALVIPITGSFYYVQPGDSLWSIGRKYSINYLILARVR
jgi:spore germination protein